ncbi:MauE/DoxX family redox-associated membrane protein [Pedobacter hiemivivus]|nr:MauE/DoxX family redox-associated membrane protein [Pedobacter hiemivivus]
METTMNKQSKSWLSDKIKRIIVDIITYLYVLLFLYTAASKLMDYENSELQMSKSPIITEFAYILVWLVPTIEIIISLLLIWTKTNFIGLYVSFMLMIIFTAYIIAILNLSSHIPCSCGGVISALNWNEHLIFNIIFIILAFIAISLKSIKH